MVDDVTVGRATTTSSPNSLLQLCNQQTEISSQSQQQAINKNMFVQPPVTSTPSSQLQQSQQQAINKNMFVQPPVTSTPSSQLQQSQQQAINENMFVQPPVTSTLSSLLQQTEIGSQSQQLMELLEYATDQIVSSQLGQHTEINRKQTFNSSIQTQTVLATADCGTQTVEEYYCDSTASAKFTFNSDHT